MILSEIQKTQIKLLNRLSVICKENNIDYFLIDGSALGAFYLGKMLPWDDDIDVGMYIDDYYKFLSICNRLNDSNYYMKDCVTDTKFGCSFGQFIDTSIPLSQINNINSSDIKGIFIDIHPFVDESKYFIIKIWNYYSFKFVKHLLLNKRNYSNDKSLKNRILLLISKFIDDKCLIQYIDNRRRKKYSSGIAVKIHGRYFDDYIYKSNLSKLNYMPFDDLFVPMMPDVKRMIDKMYGKFDPNKNEINRHDFVMDNIGGKL